MTTKPGRTMSYFNWPPPIKLLNLLISDLARSRENQNHYIFTTIVPMAITFDMMMTFLDGLASIKLLYFKVAWSCKITSEVKTITSPLPNCP